MPLPLDRARAIARSPLLREGEAATIGESWSEGSPALARWDSEEYPLSIVPGRKELPDGLVAVARIRCWDAHSVVESCLLEVNRPDLAELVREREHEWHGLWFEWPDWFTKDDQIVMLRALRMAGRWADVDRVCLEGGLVEKTANGLWIPLHDPPQGCCWFDTGKWYQSWARPFDGVVGEL